MITVNSISGGKTSAYISANYKADYNIFSLVRNEDQKTKFPDEKIRREVEDRIQAPFISTSEINTIIYTILDLEQFIGTKIDWVTGKTFEESIAFHGDYLPNRIARYCTTEMKTIPILKFILDNLDSTPEMRFGFRANEIRRADNMLKKVDEDGLVSVKATFSKHPSGRNKWVDYKYCKPVFPLIKDNLYKDNIETFWNDKPVRFAYLNNCVGCWWRSPMLLKKMHDLEPDKIDWYAREEERTGNRFRADVKYRDVINYKTQLTLSFDDFDSCDSGYCGL